MPQSIKHRQAKKRPSCLAISIGYFIVFSALSLPILAAQTTPTAQAPSGEPKLPVYDVVSIKPNKSSSGNVDVTVRPGRYSGSNIAIRLLLEEAYGIKKGLISGIPGPLDSARFDIEAKVVDPDLAAIRNLTSEQRRAMVLPILTEYFHLKAHTEVKVLPVYDLVVVKSGPKFRQSSKDSEKDQGTSVRNEELEAHGVTMASFATTLADRPGVQRTVIDKTGLSGSYDLALKWSRDDDGGQDNGKADAAPPIFTALQEQLGVKLQSSKGPVETLVVDHVELPSEN